MIGCVLFITSIVAAEPQTFTITNVNIVDVEQGAIQTNQTIVVENGRISSIGKAEAVEGATNIDADFRWAIPGLWDMHVHLDSAGRGALPVLVANGVTHVRDMGGNWDRIQATRADIAAGETIGPDIHACGPFLESARWVERAKSFLSEDRLKVRVALETPADVEPALDALTKQGVDFLKFRTMQSKDVYFALARGAKERGLKLTGHAPPSAISLTDAAHAGQASIEHYIDGPGIRNLPDDKEAAFNTFKEFNTHFVPTFVSGYGFRVKPTEEVLAVIDDTTNTIDPRRRYIAPALLSFWREQMEMKSNERFSWDYEQIHADNLALFREMHHAGVSVMVGTDLGGPFVFPGFSVHDELRTFVDELGFSELDALRAATTIPAAFSGKNDEYGKIAPGKRADFVLLAGNPLDDIQHIRDIWAVMVNGRWIGPESRAEILAMPIN